VIGVVLAAGKGERLRPFTETRPKPLIPVLDKPLIWYPLTFLRSLGIERVVVVVSYMKDMLQKEVSKLCSDLGMDAVFVDQGEERGTAHAVKRALGSVDDDAVIVYGDLYIENSVARAVLRALERSREPLLVASRVSDVSRYGALVVEGDRVAEIIEKPPQGGPGLANVGIYYIPHELLEGVERIELSPRGEYELTDLAKVLKDTGRPFRYIEIGSGEWLDVGYPWTLLDLYKRVLSKFVGRAVYGDVDRIATIRGPVVVERGARIKGATYIEGPAYIGENAAIGPNTYIRPFTAILEGARIGFSVEVKESVVMEHAHAAHLAYIGDSVVGEHVNLGAGTVLANLRFDNKTVKVTIKGRRVDSGRRKLGALIGGYVKTGINVSIMPGVKIGSHAIIYPGVTVYRDVPPSTVVKTDWR